jgi:hypothetical protein
MSRRGRTAPMPDPGYEPPRRLIATDTTCVVRFYAEEGGGYIPFDFGRFPVHHDLQIAMAQGFERLTGPSGTRRALPSVRESYYALARFARLSATLPDPPRRAADITVALVDRYILTRRTTRYWSREAGTLRGVLLAIDALPLPVRAHLAQLDIPPRERESTVSSYTQAEERRIILAARHDLQAAAERIRANVDLLMRWRGGEIDRAQDKVSWERGYLLDCLATSGDLPRYTTGQRLHIDMVQRLHGGSHALVRALHLTAIEAAAACVLLISTTGVNGDAIATTTIAHERADSGADESPVAIINVVKPRRGRRARYMSIPLAQLPTWAGSHQSGEVTISELDEVTTPFGIYTLMLELTATARALCGSQRLFLWAGDPKGHPHIPFTSIVREGLPEVAVPKWGMSAGLTADQVDATGEPEPLTVSMKRLRRTYLQRHQRPVAHSVRTLSDEYLIRDRGAVVEYQRVVAQTLQEQETQVRQNIHMQVLSDERLEQAAPDPQPTAQQLGVSVDVLKRVLDGRLNTVLAACIDFTHSPFSPTGLPCTASFLMCLSCPCARATPQHLPALLLVRDALEQRHDVMTPLAWARLLAGPYAQLDDVISRFSTPAIAAARSDITDNDRRLVERLLNRELDLT